MLQFKECVMESLGNQEFVKGFNRLTGSSLCLPSAQSPIEALIDEATGYADAKQEENVQKFLAFVYEVVWIRLPPEVKDPNDLSGPPEGKSFHDLMKDQPNSG